MATIQPPLASSPPPKSGDSPKPSAPNFPAMAITKPHLSVR